MEVPLPGGRRLTIRRATGDDLPALHELYDGLSADARHARFFAAFRPSDAFLERWVGHHVLVAVDGDGRIVADGGYARLPDGNAEFALTIAADWRGWLGPFLLDLLCAEAAAEGIPNLEGEILLTNGPMLAVVRTRGHAVLAYPDVGVVRVVFSTSGSAPSWPAGSSHPRVLVEGAGGRWRHEDAARAAGFDVITCPGPAARRGRRRCPVLEGQPCALVEGADAIVAALLPSDERSVAIRAAHDAAGRTVVDAASAGDGVVATLCELVHRGE